MDKQLLRIESNPIYGRYLVAERDIKQGEILMQERPQMLGSPIAAYLICFNCARRISILTAHPCTGCRIAPVCGRCPPGGGLHTAECGALQQLTAQCPNIDFDYLCARPEVSMPLRCILLSRYDGAAWAEVVRLEAHMEARRETSIRALHEERVAAPLTAAGLLKACDVDDAEIVHRICGVLDVNAFEVRPASCNAADDLLRGLYVRPALMAHNCVSNTHLSVDEAYLMTIRAAIAIPAGDAIVFNYANCLDGNYARRAHLLAGKYFRCVCKRCEDATELGTGMSTLLCTTCRTPTVTYHAAIWRCAQCDKTYRNDVIRLTLRFAKEHVRATIQQADVGMARELVVCLRRTLAQHHALVLEAMQHLVSLLSYECDVDAAHEKAALCQELVSVLRVIEPGISRHRGIVLFEMHNAERQHAKLQYNASLITAKSYLERLQSIEGVLREAISHLIYEPKNTPEGRLAARALNDMKVLRKEIAEFQLVETLAF